MTNHLRCSQCILSDSFPGISFDEKGVCSFCRDLSILQTEDDVILKARKQVEDLFKNVKSKGTYDAVMLYSGGKDSTYTLYKAVKEHGLDVLAFTLDNGYIPQPTFDNIKKITDQLEVDLLVFRPALPHMKSIIKASALKPIYHKRTLMRISSICNSCISMVNIQALRIALEKNIPLILAGFTLGQIPVNSIVYKNNYQFMEESRMKSLGLLRENTGEWVDNYFSLPQSLVNNVKSWPTMVNLLCLEKITEDKILESISKLGWRAPVDVDGCSSNCQLNSFNNYVHENVFGYNPYELELSQMIRKGLIERSAALEKIENKIPEVFEKIATELEFPLSAFNTVRKEYGLS